MNELFPLMQNLIFWSWPISSYLHFHSVLVQGLPRNIYGLHSETGLSHWFNFRQNLFGPSPCDSGNGIESFDIFLLRDEFFRNFLIEQLDLLSKKNQCGLRWFSTLIADEGKYNLSRPVPINLFPFSWCTVVGELRLTDGF